jgi:hypothetical protein
MKSDLDKFVSLYKSVGIELHPIEKEGEGFILELKENHGFDGYAMFLSVIEFDSNGKFLKQGFWE